MKKNYKWLESNGKLYILHWADGKLFGSDWECVASFSANAENLKRCKNITKLMNECDKNINHPEYE